MLINHLDLSSSAPDDWIPYLKKTKDACEPRETLKIGLEYLKKQNVIGLAVDLGAGTGRDTLYLLKNHWRVLAVDYSQQAIDILLSRVNKQKLAKPMVQIVDISQATLPKSIDLLNASYSLPFVKPANFPDVWQNLVKRIRPGRLFAGSFFGPKDDYAHAKNITILNKSQIHNLFTGFEILYIHENKEYAVDSTGVKKQWDIWNVVAVKKTKSN